MAASAASLSSAITAIRTLPAAAARSRHRKSLIALRRDIVADLAIDPNAADIGHEDLRLARDVGAHVPGIGLRIERGVCDLVDMRHPPVLSVLLRFDGRKPVVAHIADAIGD